MNSWNARHYVIHPYYSCYIIRTNVSSLLVCSFLIMSSICCGNNGKSPFRFRHLPDLEKLRAKFFSFLSIECIYAEMCANSIRHVRCKISIRSPYAEEVGHPVPYIVPPRTICMVIRTAAEKHLGHCGGQRGDLGGRGGRGKKELSSRTRATRWGWEIDWGRKWLRTNEYRQHHFTLNICKTRVFRYFCKTRRYPNGNIRIIGDRFYYSDCCKAFLYELFLIGLLRARL